jgi:hypothetical protein
MMLQGCEIRVFGDRRQKYCKHWSNVKEKQGSRSGIGPGLELTSLQTRRRRAYFDSHVIGSAPQSFTAASSLPRNCARQSTKKNVSWQRLQSLRPAWSDEALHLLFVECENSADRRIVEVKEACHLHLAINVGCNSCGDEMVSGCFAWASL